MYMHISQAGTHRIRTSIPNCIFSFCQTKVIRKAAPGRFELLGKLTGESVPRSVALLSVGCVVTSYYHLDPQRQRTGFGCTHRFG